MAIGSDVAEDGLPADAAQAVPPVTASGVAPCIVVLSRFVVANGMAAEVKAAFRARPHLVEDAPGFVEMQVLSPLARPEEIWLMTSWADEASYRTWHRSHAYHAAHKGIPKGLKLVPLETSITIFEHVAS